MRSGGYKKVPQASTNSVPDAMNSSTRPAGARASVGLTTLRVATSPGSTEALTNRAYCSPNDIAAFPEAVGTRSRLITVSNAIPSRDQVPIVLTVEPHSSVADGTLALNAYHRRTIKVSANDEISVNSFQLEKGSDLMALTLDIQFVKYRTNQTISATDFAQRVSSTFAGQVLTVGQMVSVDFIGTNYFFTVKQTLVGAELKESSRGLLKEKTHILFESAGNSGIKIIDQKSGTNSNLFKAKDFNFQKLGIGGLDAEFQDIFRRAFSSRVFPSDVISRLGIQHVKGMLLWGPPGTGKTLIARQIGKMLNGKEPKIVNGPEVLSKFVGETEKNVRDLFADAEKDQREHGDQSELHIIIFDEIDAICKSRGSTRDGTGVHDSIVNQLLTKIDGVESLNNILLIGMTNRKDMLDEALLRPGRLEVQIEIGLPDEHGRVQILQIHTSKMRGSDYLDNISLEDLAAQTKNFSGAELEGLVKSAVSFALDRQIDYQDLSKPLDEKKIKVTMEDFLAALREVKPAFGAAVASLERCRVNSMLDCGLENFHIQKTALSLVDQLRTSERTPLLSCLLEGPSGSGKTALAATVGIESAKLDVPFVKIISAETMVGLSESSKCGMINKVFEDAYKSPLSIIILDDIERLLEYVYIGPRFSNLILQTLLVLVKRLPPEKRKLLVIGTTSQKRVLHDMDMLSTFNVILNVPVLKRDDMRKVLSELNVFTDADLETAVTELPENEMPIKKLLMLVEMSKQGGGLEVDGEQKIDINRFLECYHDLS